MKKLIIEIDDQTYRAVQLHPGCFNFAHAILNGKPLQTEYEEIKAEIESEKDKLKMKNFNVITGMEVGIDILNKRIKELNNE